MEALPLLSIGSPCCRLQLSSLLFSFTCFTVSQITCKYTFDLLVVPVDKHPTLCVVFILRHGLSIVMSDYGLYMMRRLVCSP
uniref:Uncharacterized protein n=1 Tax=Arundo donax TaxID=35708 RepID=A0A0A9AZ81_ARUDO